MNNFIITLLIVAVSSSVIIAEVTLAIWIVFKKIMPAYQRSVANLTVNELLLSLNTIIENEISVYERSLFEGGGKVVSNAQFDNYYKDITARIINSLSEDFFTRMSFFMKKEAVVSLICRTVKIYLSEKII